MVQSSDSRSLPDVISVVFVCLGNICRSPLAEGVFRHRLKERGLADYFSVDSAGTGAWHIGQSPDVRMAATAASEGISLATIRARQFRPDDLRLFDHIFAMDRTNLLDVLSLDNDSVYGYKVRLFRELDPLPEDYQVPDPYYGRGDGFKRVFDIVDRTIASLIERFTDEYNLRPRGDHDGPDSSGRGGGAR